MSSENEEQAKFWSERAPEWLEVEDRLEQVSGEPGRWAMDALSVSRGDRVLDLGCGSGRTTLELASRVGGEGLALGVDIAPEMIEHARRHVESAGRTNVDFVVADVQAHAFPSGSFDKAFSRFGVMFFSEPVTAFSNVRKALGPEGSLCFVCWQSVFENEWMLIPGAAVMSVIGTLPPMPDPGEPGPFSLADPERLKQLLSEAGFTDVELTPHNDFVAVPETQIHDIAGISMKVGAAREGLRDADAETAERVLEAVEAALRDRLVDGEARVSRGVWLVMASK